MQDPWEVDYTRAQTVAKVGTENTLVQMTHTSTVYLLALKLFALELKMTESSDSFL